ncbi:MAG TPA: PilZ domain-containing protein [Tepidisphaeraceae bacterium]|nr:PilZ domain-containing protein [Tepidisphaeraceae bacterium]
MPLEFPDGFPFVAREEINAAPPLAESFSPTPAPDDRAMQQGARATPLPAAAPCAIVEAPALAKYLHAPVAPQSPIRERRRAARQTLVARATVRPHNPLGPGGPSAAGYVSNISLLGIGLHTRRPLSIGERYHIKLEAGPMKWTSHLRVVSCQPHPSGTWDIGAHFIANELSVRRTREMAA